MDKHATPFNTVGERGNKKLAQPSDSTVTFLINFARLYAPVVEKPQTGRLLN